jgi:hypothetical protein
VVAPSFLHVGGSSCCLVAAMSCADFCGWIDGAQRQSMISVGEVTAEEERDKFLCTQPESNLFKIDFDMSKMYFSQSGINILPLTKNKLGGGIIRVGRWQMVRFTWISTDLLDLKFIREDFQSYVYFARSKIYFLRPMATLL